MSVTNARNNLFQLREMIEDVMFGEGSDDLTPEQYSAIEDMFIKVQETCDMLDPEYS
jgi:hypothetical protein